MKGPGSAIMMYPVDIFGTVVGESPDCLLLSGTVVGENPDYVCWVYSLFEDVGLLLGPLNKLISRALFTTQTCVSVFALCDIEY